jgi:hypothetical protein
MREIRTSGSEGGGAGYPTSPSYPYQRHRVFVVSGLGLDGSRSLLD